MNRFQILWDEKATLVREGEGIYAKAEADGGRARTDQENQRLDQIDARLAALEPEIQAEKEQNDRRLARLASVGGATPPSAGQFFNNSLVVGADRELEKPWGYELGVRYVTKSDGTRALGGVPRAAELALGACIVAGSVSARGGATDRRFLEAAASGGNTSDPAAGGLSVGTDLTMILFQMGEEASKLLPYCRTIEVSQNADGIEAPYITDTSRATGSRFGGVRVYRRKEAATVASSFPEEEKFELRLADLMGIAYQTDRMLSDARSLGQMYATAFRNEFAFVIDDEAIRGDGVGQMQGVLNSPALVSQTKEVGQAANTVVWENLTKMWIRLPTASKSKAVWFINGELGPQLDALSLPAGTGALEPRFVNYGPDGILRIKGRPVVEIDQASALGTVGDILLLDLSEYIVVRKGVLEQAESDHVRFLYAERALRWMQRINGKSPWRTAVTPYKGSATRSPFVALETRA